MGIADTDPTPICCLILASKIIRYECEGQDLHGGILPVTGLYNRAYYGASKPIAQNTVSLPGVAPHPTAGSGLKLFIAFMTGGVVFSIIGAMMSDPPASPPAPPPAAVIAPVVPSPCCPC
jgi:hypothetical protein